MKLDVRNIINTVIAGLLLAMLISGASFYSDVTRHMERVDVTLKQIGENLSLLNAALGKKER